MPMGGLGSRFAKAGFTTPKPLVPVDGRPMFRKALSSLDGISAPKRFTIVIRQEHADQYQLDKMITEALPGARVVVIPKVTGGAAETVLAATDGLDRDAGLVSIDCDFWFASKAYDQMVEETLADRLDISAGLLTFETTDPRYSFAAVGPDSFVTRTAEKVAISDRGIWGAYFFRRVSSFEEVARQLLMKPLGEDLKEYYISPLFNMILGRGEKVKAAMVEEFSSFGTPEELDRYVGHHVEPS